MKLPSFSINNVPILIYNTIDDLLAYPHTIQRKSTYLIGLPFLRTELSNNNPILKILFSRNDGWFVRTLFRPKISVYVRSVI